MSDFNNILNKTKELFTEINSDDELKAKVSSSITKFSTFEVEPPKVDEQSGRIMIYLTAGGDVGKVSIPIIFVVGDASETQEVAEEIHEFISEYILKILRSVYDTFRLHANEIKSPEDALPIVAQVLGDIISIATEDKFNQMGEVISSSIIDYKIVSDLHDEDTFELVQVDPAPNVSAEEFSTIVTNMLIFVDRLWSVFLQPLISNLSIGS